MAGGKRKTASSSKKESTKKSKTQHKASKDEMAVNPDFRVGILTYDNDFSDLTKNDAKVREALKKLNIDSEYIIWSKPLPDLKKFDAVIILSVWDYQKPENYENFMNVLSVIDKEVPLMFNPRSTIEWNSKKTYLQDLKTNGVPVIETRYAFKGQLDEVKTIVEKEGWKEFVIKPVVSAGGEHTVKTSADEFATVLPNLDKADIKEWMLQPFAEEIVKEGEYSFFFIKDHFSHAIIKKPASNNFLVQKKYGGKASAAKPKKAWIEQAHDVLKKCGHDYLFARVDGVIREEQLTLMELEMIEPYLFLDFGKNFCSKFASTMQEILKSHKEAKGSS